MSTEIQSNKVAFFLFLLGWYSSVLAGDHAEEWTSARIGICNAIFDTASGPKIDRALDRLNNDAQLIDAATPKDVITHVNGKIIKDADDLYREVRRAYFLELKSPTVELTFDDNKRAELKFCIEGKANDQFMIINRWESGFASWVLNIFGLVSFDEKYFEIKSTAGGFEVWDLKPRRLSQSMLIVGEFKLANLIEVPDKDHISYYEKHLGLSKRDFKIIQSDAGKPRLVIYYDWSGKTAREAIPAFISAAKQDFVELMNLSSQLYDLDLKRQEKEICRKPAPTTNDNAAVLARELRSIICK